MSLSPHRVSRFRGADALILAGILVSAAACYQSPALSPQTAALERQPPPPAGEKGVQASPDIKMVSALEAVSPDKSALPTAKSALVDKIRSVKAVHGFPGVDVILMDRGAFAVKIHSGMVGAGEPLYVIDGHKITLSGSRGIDWFKPEDIAQIRVLKSAYELAVYGPDGVNGVVLITTKQAVGRSR